MLTTAREEVATLTILRPPADRREGAAPLTSRLLQEAIAGAERMRTQRRQGRWPSLGAINNDAAAGDWRRRHLCGG